MSVLQQLLLSGGKADPMWSNVVFLLGNDNLPNGTSSFVDQSSSAKSITRNGSSVVYSNAQAPSGMTTSLYFNGGTNYLYTSDHDDWSVNGDMTWEAMVYHTSFPAYPTYVGHFPDVSGSNGAWWVLGPRIGSDNNFYFEYTTNGSTPQYVNVSTAITANVWYHVAYVKTGTSIKFYVNGTQIGTTQTIANSTLYNSTASMCIGGGSGGGSYNLNGYMSNIRITKAARYTANFTPPTLPLPS